jgi:hypothetical protein
VKKGKEDLMALTPIDKFEVMYSANTFSPRIWLLSGTNFIGQLIFMPDGTALPQDAMVNGQVNLYYHLEDFENVMELFRNESPLSLLFSGSGGGFENGILTAQDVVGVGEREAATAGAVMQSAS